MIVKFGEMKELKNDFIGCFFVCVKSKSALYKEGMVVEVRRAEGDTGRLYHNGKRLHFNGYSAEWSLIENEQINVEELV